MYEQSSCIDCKVKCHIGYYIYICIFIIYISFYVYLLYIIYLILYIYLLYIIYPIIYIYYIY